MTHDKTQFYSAAILLPACLLLLFALDVYAMSQSPNDEMESRPYTPSSWNENSIAENDATRALANADFRLLAFATRGTDIPGIDASLRQAYRERCGIRFIEGFGDVVRSEKQLENMKLAREYAARYNAVIIAGCPPAK